jgi:hypothetical protein
MSHIIPRRIVYCANREGGCTEPCPPGAFHCSGHCRAACDERSAARHIGGSLERHDAARANDPDGQPLVTERNWQR